jgi:hypothetical protein
LIRKDAAFIINNPEKFYPEANWRSLVRRKETLMPARLRKLVVVLVVGLLALYLVSLRDACLQRDWLREIGRREEIQRLHQVTQRHQEGQYQAVQEWISQRCTLEETLQRLEELEEERDRDLTGYTSTVWEHAPLSDQDRHHQFILLSVKTELSERPEELTAVLRRLEKDYQQLQADRQTPSTDRTDGKERNR